MSESAARVPRETVLREFCRGRLVVDDVRPSVRCAVSVLESAGVTFEDDRVKYVEIQVDRDAWLRWKKGHGIDDE